MSAPQQQGQFERARAWIAQAQTVAVLTGAGISAESGVPTFRGPGGLWKDYRPEDLASPRAFAEAPALVWEWYNWRRELIAQKAPNPAHHALVRLEAAKPRFTLITQNVDGLHARAGSRNLVCLHGDIWTMQCSACGAQWTDLRPSFPELLPRCACGQVARPGVVWFGEALPEGAMETAERAAASAEVLLVVGTSAQVYPAAGLIPHAQRAGARVIELNLEPTPFTHLVDCALPGPAAELLPLLVD